MNNSEQLAAGFLEKSKHIAKDIAPIKILKARAYTIGQANVLIRVASEGNRNYFFGLNYIHVEEFANLDNPYFVFICGSLERVLFVPAKVLIDALPNISHDRNGEYKINIDANLDIVLKGRGCRLKCHDFINTWDILNLPSPISNDSNDVKNSPEQSYHSVLQGRLLEIGRHRGFETFCPNKSKRFNNRPLGEIASLSTCPSLEFSDYDLLRQIDVLWFRKKNNTFIPEYGFEVELTTGTWSGVGRLATLLDYANTHLYIISNDQKKYRQVMNAYADYQKRYRFVGTEDLGDLYGVELHLRELRARIDL